MLYIRGLSNRCNLVGEDYSNHRHVVCHTEIFSYKETERSVGKFYDNVNYLSA